MVVWARWAAKLLQFLTKLLLLSPPLAALVRILVMMFEPALFQTAWKSMDKVECAMDWQGHFTRVNQPVQENIIGQIHFLKVGKTCQVFRHGAVTLLQVWAKTASNSCVIFWNTSSLVMRIWYWIAKRATSNTGINVLYESCTGNCSAFNRLICIQSVVQRLVMQSLNR